MGHTIRCIPIIKILLANNYKIMIAAEGIHSSILQKQFPQIPIIPIKGYHIKYPKNKKILWLSILLQIPKLFYKINYEHQWLKKQQKKYQFDFIISDNRYGLYHSKTTNIFITHQLQIQTPFGILTNWLQTLHYKHIQKFTMCWIPDLADKQHNLGGNLSHPIKMPAIPCYYINLLTRYPIENNTLHNNQKIYDYCFLLSGPEPQRTVFENIILQQIINSEDKILFIRGVAEEKLTLELKPNITIINFVDAEELKEKILQSHFIIARSGYTSVMELTVLQCKVMYVPTPQQTEQIYLAKNLQKQNTALYIEQINFDMRVIKEKILDFKPNFKNLKCLEAKDIIPLRC